MKQGGGIAGHNGLRDISQRLGTHDYWRLRWASASRATGTASRLRAAEALGGGRAAIDDAIDAQHRNPAACLRRHAGRDAETAQRESKRSRRKKPRRSGRNQEPS
jgi:peptidyl-tRNA hydrolase